MSRNMSRIGIGLGGILKGGKSMNVNKKLDLVNSIIRKIMARKTAISISSNNRNLRKASIKRKLKRWKRKVILKNL